ncbi:MAG: twin-arginine translocase subunit TatC [Pedococcus sp.]
MAFRRARNPDGRMTLGDHLRELRRRLLTAAIALVVGAIGGWYLYDPVYEHLTRPLLDIAAERGDGNTIALNFAGLTAAFSQRVSIAIFVGVIVSSPVWLFQLWAFIVPGLTKKERNISLAFIAAAAPLFLGGCWFAYQTLPKAVQLLISFTPDGAVNYPEAALYFSFVTRFILVFGAAFLMPVFLVALNVVHVLPASVMRKTWRPAFVIIFVFAAIATPTPDPFTMFLLAIPLCVLYLGALGVATLIDRRRAKDKPQWAEELSDDEASTL